MSELTAVEKHQQEFNQKVKGMKEEIEDNFGKDDIIDLLVTTELSNEKLREENEKWEYWASEVIHWSHSASKDNLQAKKLITPDNKPTIGDVRDFGEEIKKLKEQLDKMWGSQHNLNVLLTELDEDIDQDVFDGISFPHPNPEKEGAEMMLMYKNKMNDTLKVYPDRQTLKEENKKLKETIRSQGDQLVIFHSKEEKPDTPSSTCAKVILQIKDDEIKQLKEQLKLERFTQDNDVQIKKIVELEEKNKKLQREFEAFQERVNEVFTKE